MRIAILSNGNINYSTLRLKEEAEKLLNIKTATFQLTKSIRRSFTKVRKLVNLT